MLPTPLPRSGPTIDSPTSPNELIRLTIAFPEKPSCKSISATVTVPTPRSTTLSSPPPSPIAIIAGELRDTAYTALVWLVDRYRIMPAEPKVEVKVPGLKDKIRKEKE